MNNPAEERGSAIAACDCPRTQGEIFDSPKCAVDFTLGVGMTVLFVTAEKYCWCKHLIGFGNTHFCNCANRLNLYKKYGL
jgi:hypothetical protein